MQLVAYLSRGLIVKYIYISGLLIKLLLLIRYHFILSRVRSTTFLFRISSQFWDSYTNSVVCCSVASYRVAYSHFAIHRLYIWDAFLNLMMTDRTLVCTLYTKSNIMEMSLRWINYSWFGNKSELNNNSRNLCFRKTQKIFHQVKLEFLFQLHTVAIIHSSGVILLHEQSENFSANGFWGENQCNFSLRSLL